MAVYFFAGIALLFLFNGLTNGRVLQWPSIGTNFFGFIPTIYVDQSGFAHFETIQSAIDSIPSNNSYWICIFINSGLYKEQVTIPVDKPFIYLKGADVKTTVVIWGAHDSLVTSPTFSSFADNIIVENLNFTNSYNYPPENNGNQMKPALAAMISGDKSAFYGCAFSGLQDTLLDDNGRHYFKLCTIEGAMDFIFGTGQSIYEDCTILVNAGSITEDYAGYITAQGRLDPNDANGFVFKNCKVIGTGKAFLGRAWRGYARVLFYKTDLSNIIVPQGWDAWNFKGHEDQLTFSEEDCDGDGADTSKRVRWEKKLSKNMVESLTDLSFIDTDNWINGQPFILLN
ncbi:putative pectinesterase 29 [Nicotiana tabacum]|uniref:pectinesterase n=1 Tax=Nicotiana tabacum TaxID=4097 RepID=A0A1S4DNU0_TOBAC|nr:probable pectinesterase 29 [Nicotiana tomentosiformis]XP_016514819.1 PREDICTED: probable pectinesterase 29 [Nicotiana tabacum]